MLLNLYVKNFAIIEEINLNFSEGLNIISGETGSGKSLLLKTLSLLKGDRFTRDYLGSFSDKTIVEAVFKSNAILKNFLIENGFEADENIILTREFTDNSTINKINNRACSLKIMSDLTDLIFDIHGQHSSLIVLNKANYINMIDNFNDKTIDFKNKIKANLKEEKLLKERLEDLKISPEELEREKDLLKYQIEEIEAFDFDKYDENKLNKEYKKLSNQKELIEGTNSLLSMLNDNNRSLSFKDFAFNVYSAINDLASMDDDLKDLSSWALNIREEINDFSKNLEDYSYTLDIDEERIQIIEDLFSSFQVLKMKYGRDKEEILKFLDDSKERYQTISNIDKVLKDINTKLYGLDKDNQKIADQLSKLRKEIAANLEKRIVDELQEMNMDHIKFKIAFKKKDNINKDGIDDIDFMISTNKGQDLKSLSQVSSGGEISRFMLAMKAVLSESDSIQTIIFDEIDTGISGKTADIVGDKLKKISKSIQLIVISHLAQIAAKSDSHYLISKDVVGEKTISNVNVLDEDGKIKEIARLISGHDITEKSLSNARELLEV